MQYCPVVDKEVTIDEFDQVIKQSSIPKKININITKKLSDANAR